MVKHRKNSTSAAAVHVNGQTTRETKKRFYASKWALVAAFVVVFGGLGSAFVFASHADTISAPINNLYRLRNSEGHMYTTSADEKKSAEANGFTYESTYQFVNESGVEKVPVYGAVKGTSHFLTASLAEYQAVQQPSNGYKGEGIRFYGAPTSPSSQVPAGYCRQDWYGLAKGTIHLYTPVSSEATSAEASGYMLEGSSVFALDHPCTSPAPTPAPTPIPPAKPTPTPVTKPAPTPTPTSPPKVYCSALSATEERCAGSCPSGTTGKQNPTDKYYYCNEPVLCQPITYAGKPGQRCDGVCPTGTTGSKAGLYYYCFKPESAPTKPPTAGGGGTVAGQSKDDGCGPSGNANTATTCRCAAWTPAANAVYQRSPLPRSTSEATCSHAPVNGNVNCYTPGQTIAIYVGGVKVGTKCLYSGDVTCNAALGYTSMPSNNGRYCQGPGQSGSSRNLKTCLYIGWSVTGAKCYPPSNGELPGTTLPKTCTGPIITTKTHEKDCTIQ